MPSNARHASMLLAMLLAMLIAVAPLRAFQTPLSEQSIREAYFLGQRNDESTRAFFRPYLQTFPRPATGPWVSEVEVYTPFSQLVEISSRRNNYSAQQAAEEYRQTTDTVYVRIRIEFTPTYGTAQFFAGSPQERSAQFRANFDRDFRIGLLQSAQWVEPLDMEHYLTDSPPTGHFAFDPEGSAALLGSRNQPGYAISGWLVWLQFDANAVESDRGQVEIFGPADQHVVAGFDFERLR